MKKNINFKRGFTLIELLVVIAIIGILAAVVLASLSVARAKSSDAAVKQNLSGIRNQAAIFLDNEVQGNGTYGVAYTAGDCATSTSGSLFEDSTIANQYTAAAAASGAGVVASCVASPDAWAVSVPLKTDNTISWCVDSTGAAKEVTNDTDLGFSGEACE